MRRCDPRLLSTLCVGALTLTACESPGPTPLEYGVRNVAKRERAAMLDTAEAALVAAGFQIDNRDPVAGVVTTLPIESSTTERAGRTRARTRRVAEVRFADGGESLKVYCKVMVQELASGAYGLYAQDRATTDSPGEYTAINRDAATTEKQNTLWRTVRRDKMVERTVLDQIQGISAGEK